MALNVPNHNKCYPRSMNTSGETAGPMTESTALQPEQLHGSSHAFNSTPGSNPGVPTTLEPGQYKGPSHIHIPNTGSSSIATNGLNTGYPRVELRRTMHPYRIREFQPSRRIHQHGQLRGDPPDQGQTT